MRILLACLILFFGFFSAFGTVWAQGAVTGGQLNEALDKLTHVRVLPDNPFYFIFRTKEILGRFFTPSAKDRAEFDFMISSKRIKEAYLLAQKGSSVETSFTDYKKAIKNSELQIEKARGQSQDVATVIAKMVDDLKYQDVLIETMQENGVMVDDAKDGFGGFVVYLEKFRPGIGGTYQITAENKVPDPSLPSVVSTPSPNLSATPSYQPKRIIY